MRFEREKDIPALQGKTRKERQALREHARTQDSTIRNLESLGVILMLFFIPLADWLANRFRTHSLLVWFGIYVVITVPFVLGLRGVFIIPRVRRALASDEDTEA